MKCHPRRWVPSEELKTALHRNALRIALALLIAVGLLLFVPWVAKCHRFNGIDMVGVLGLLFAKISTYKGV